MVAIFIEPHLMIAQQKEEEKRRRDIEREGEGEGGVGGADCCFQLPKQQTLGPCDLQCFRTSPDPDVVFPGRGPPEVPTPSLGTAVHPVPFFDGPGAR